MPLFKTPFPSAFKRPTLASSLSPLSNQPTQTSHLPKNHQHLLLSLLHKHKSTRTSLQIHTQLITTALHSSHMPRTGVLVWNSLIKLYSQSPSPHHSIHLYKQMLHACVPRPPFDTFTFSFLIKSCAGSPSPGCGAQLHCVVIKNGFALHLYVHTCLVNMYAACGSLSDARNAFEEMPERSSVSWNSLITGFAKWGEVGEARLLFDRMPDPDVVSWTGMIDGYTRIQQFDKALGLFREMNEKGIMPTEITVLAVVPAVSNTGSLDSGETLHAHCKKRGLIVKDVRVENSLIDMYAKCGSIENANRIFDYMVERKNLVSWTTIITGFAMHGMVKEAIQLFGEMTNLKIIPNRVTFLVVVNACSHGGLIEEGLRIFSSMVFEYKIEPEMKHYGCVIDMLGRAGRLKEAEEIISRMPVAVNVVVWRSLLGCCGKYGEAEMGERVMKRIVELEKEYGGDYVVLSNMLSEVGRFGDAERVRREIDDRNLMKVPGLSLIPGVV